MRVQNLIGGDWVDGASTIDVEDPSTGEVIGGAPAASPEDVARAVVAAGSVRQAWASVPPGERERLVRRVADELERRRGDLVSTLSREGGRPLREARGEIDKAITTFRYYGGLAGSLDGRAVGAGPGYRHETRREPIGTVVAITPWNVPAASPARKLAPAMLAGAPIILKPASATPLTAALMVQAIADAGAPAGAVQLVAGSGGTVGRGLASASDIAAVTFTGSTEVGLQLQSQLSGRLVRTQLELGGKNAAIVLDDADLGSAAEVIVAAAYASAGQQCTATSRVIVQRSVARELTEAILDRVGRLVVGPTDDEATTMGPLIDRAQVEATAGFVERATAEGAAAVHGGKVLPGPGHYYAPTVLTGVEPDMEIAREEVFGPVLALLEVEDEEESLRVCNDTVYGLAAAIHTRDLDRAQALSERIDCGVVAVNGPTAGIDLPLPFGGFKLSGTATKEHGPEAMEFFTRTKLVSWRS